MREVVTASREGGASLNVLSGLVAGNFSAYWLGIVIVGLMGVAFGSAHRPRRLFPIRLMHRPARCSPSAWWPSASSAWAR